MGRAPCCDKANVKKGPWSPEEDAKLKSYIEQNGTGGNWIALPQKIGLKRCGKSCRLRWLNYLRPNIKHGGFSEEEDNIICSLYVSIGSRWSVIAAQLPGRTDNDIKNYWNTRLKKKLLGKHRKEQQQARNNNRGINNIVVKQESNYSESFSLVQETSTTTHQVQPCWPQIINPVLPQYTNQGESFNDQDSIKKLLIKLGGKFSDHDDNYHPTLDDGFNLQFSQGASSTQEIYQQVQFEEHNNDQYCAQGEGLELVQGQGNFNSAIEEMGCINYPQRLNGLEFFYGEDNNAIGSTSNCSQIRPNNWGETNTPIIYHPPLVDNSNYQGQGVSNDVAPQDQCVLQEFSYPGS